MDPIILARIQFAANISFHILFPTITIALAGRCCSSSCVTTGRATRRGWTPIASG